MRTQSLMFVHSEVDDAGLSMKAFRVLGHLHRRAGNRAQAWPGVESIADTIGLNRKTVIEALAELVAAGFVIREPRRRNSTAYHLSGPSSASSSSPAPAPGGPQKAGSPQPRTLPENGLKPVRKSDAGLSGKRTAESPENGSRQDEDTPGKRTGPHPENGLNPVRKTGHKDHPFKGLKEGNPPLPPPPAGGTAGLRPPPRTGGPEDCATAGDQAPVPEPLRDAPGFPAAWESFCRHRRNLWRLNRTPWTRDAAASLLEKCRLHGAAAAVAAIARTIESGKWTGLYFDAGRGGNQSGFRSYGHGNGHSRSSSTGPRPFQTETHAQTQGQARTQAPQAAAAPAPPPEDPFAESRRNRDRLRRELEGEPPPGWHEHEHGHDRETIHGGEARAA